MTRDTRQIADDLRSVRRMERVFEALNRPALRRDRVRDGWAAARAVMAVFLAALGAGCGALITYTLICF